MASMNRSWAAEFSPQGVRVNAVAPGAVHSIPEKYDVAEGFGKTSLLGRGAQVDEIAEVIAFLASDKASYLTGVVLAADGGRTATAGWVVPPAAISRSPLVGLPTPRGHARTHSHCRARSPARTSVANSAG